MVFKYCPGQEWNFLLCPKGGVMSCARTNILHRHRSKDGRCPKMGILHYSGDEYWSTQDGTSGLPQLGIKKVPVYIIPFTRFSHFMR